MGTVAAGSRLEDLDTTGRAVDPDPVAGGDALGGDRGADDRRDAELAGEHGRMRRRAAGIGDEPGDLGEQDDPGRVGHLADQEVAVAHGIELVDRQHDPGDALDDTRRAGDALDLADVRGLLAMEPLRVAPVDEIREGELARGHGADPVARGD